MESISDYLDRFIAFMNSCPAGEWQDIQLLAENPQKLVDSIKYLIAFENKPYTFNHDYTKVKRDVSGKLLRHSGSDQR